MKTHVNNVKTIVTGSVIFGLAIIALVGFTAKKNHPVSSNSINSVIPPNGGIQMSYEQFNQAKTDWANSHPGAEATLGGSISKEALMEVLNNLPPENKNVSLYFGTDESGKTFIMFAPVGASATSKIYRNNSFCPSICN